MCVAGVVGLSRSPSPLAPLPEGEGDWLAVAAVLWLAGAWQAAEDDEHSVSFG